MTAHLRDQIIELAQKAISPADPTHDFSHARRVLGLVERLAKAEGADLDILVPAALLHDVVVYPKHGVKRDDSSGDSAKEAERLLSDLPDYPKAKIGTVKEAIAGCSFRRPADPINIEIAILQDADWLEATGAVAIMRTFAYTGVIGRPLYHANDPFAQQRQPDATHNALDLFYERLLQVEGRLHTASARTLARGRTEFLRKFLVQLEQELREDNQL